jgi:lipoprotein-anchoring transpeptidase ErfK/SrfK
MGWARASRARVRLVASALAVITAAALAGCGDDGDGARFVAGQPSQSAGAPAVAASEATSEPLSLKITPAANAHNLPVSTEIGTALTGGQIDAVVLKDAAGKTVAGDLREDKSSWVPRTPLKYDTKYTATVTARNDAGQTDSKTTSFTTMGQPGNQIGSGMYLFDGRTYGVAMPVVVEFVPGIPKKDRAAVQRRMFVTSSPSQPGAWHWTDSGTQAFYRAREYWQPGTTLTVRVALEGIPLSNGKYGNEDRRVTAKIGDKLVMRVDNKTKKMQVFEGDRLVKTFPVSLGKASTPSSSGTMVVMDKLESTIFDTFAELGPSEGYRTEIDMAQRLTWGGEFIHSAPWSVGDQGVRNVSHGCVNLSPANANWLFSKTKIGDPITVRGTERRLEDGNGWTAWNMSWEDFIKGSALPVTVTANTAGSTTPSAAPVGASPSPSA